MPKKVEPLEIAEPVVKSTASAWTKVLIVISVVFVSSTIALSVTLGVREATRPPPVSIPTECTTPGCIKAAARVDKWINKTEDPCNDFFEFACGNWINDRVIPEEKSYLSTFTDLRDDMLVKVKRILDDENVLTPDPKANRMIQKMRKYYKICLARDTPPAYGTAGNMLTQLFSILPLPYINATGWEHAKNNFDEFIADFATFGEHIIVNSNVEVDIRNTSRWAFVVDQPPLELGSRRYYLQNNSKAIRDAYKILMERVLIKVYADLNITATPNIQAMLDFQIAIANATTPLEERRDFNKTDNRWTVRQLKQSTTLFNWEKYLQRRLNRTSPVPDSYEVIVRAPEYFAKLDGLLSAQSNFKETLGQIITFYMVSRIQGSMPKDYRELHGDFFEVFRGTRGDDTRWKQCAKNIKDFVFKDVISRIYSQEHFDQAAKTEAMNMIKYVRNAFYELLKINTWMDVNTRAIAAKKAESMIERIGFPEYVFNGTYLEETYSVIPVTNEHNYVTEQMEILLIQTRRVLQRLTETVNRNEWMTQSVVVNAFYSPSFNQIYFPMGILASPFFDKDYPQYLNYGGIGAVIGHEITHGFDDSGRQRDGNGNYRPWWPQSTVENFKSAAQCIVDQYSQYKAPITIQNINVNGARTQGENIADNGGVKQSFEGYQEWVKTRGKKELKLPGIPYTPEQLFFINYGQIWCTAMRPKEWISRIYSGVHSPSMYRVIGTLSNTPYFQEAFQCKVGDKMNPAKKCSVW